MDQSPPAPAPPRQTQTQTQTFSLELEPELLTLLAERDREQRQRANSLPSRPRKGTFSANANAPSNRPAKRRSSLDPSAPEFTPSSLSLALSLTRSISPPTLSPSISNSTLSLSPPDSPTDPRIPFPLPPFADPLASEHKIFRRQPYDAFLLLDVEATCDEGVGFDYPNEIIEWPVVLMRWNEMDTSGRMASLTPFAEFRSFVRPTWATQLTPFCTSLTGITQSHINNAPTFPEVLAQFREFLVLHGLLDPETDEQLVRYTFVTDGPWDLRDFLVKQCWLSDIPVPAWVGQEVVDVRQLVRVALRTFDETDPDTEPEPEPEPEPAQPEGEPERERERGTKHTGLSLPCQLHNLSLPPFQGRQHSGIDDARNVARVLQELARRGWVVERNSSLMLGEWGLGWDWMGPTRGSVVRGEKWKGWAPGREDWEQGEPVDSTANPDPVDVSDDNLLLLDSHSPQDLLQDRQENQRQRLRMLLSPIPESAPPTPFAPSPELVETL
ncbi:hypothetical protein DACRYDRAFT_75019 [Dacryopinax primogenitus]|uniref:Exonuclease domain-containing protein n=1 Tax=Dacryopinax primogenitus (strain DJM 731) TaxID=1858805 RepID=M5GBE1_DACPD|nr:uncharacterized protein DACRYDRAFT_75019 [Dacryopinax primogenitus]EJU05690.1 hypothetical protein DACRYDRAFT_75019 [Dacryopinax primogenitus]